jgi:hypothetical protein
LKQDQQESTAQRKMVCASLRQGPVLDFRYCRNLSGSMVLRLSEAVNRIQQPKDPAGSKCIASKNRQ